MLGSRGVLGWGGWGLGVGGWVLVGSGGVWSCCGREVGGRSVLYEFIRELKGFFVKVVMCDVRRWVVG